MVNYKIIRAKMG